MWFYEGPAVTDWFSSSLSCSSFLFQKHASHSHGEHIHSRPTFNSSLFLSAKFNTHSLLWSAFPTVWAWKWQEDSNQKIEIFRGNCTETHVVGLKNPWGSIIWHTLVIFGFAVTVFLHQCFYPLRLKFIGIIHHTDAALIHGAAVWHGREE